jgi:lipopolysaccharide transport system ATP-binding protein
LNICTRAILIRQGRVAHDGTAQDAIDLYQSDLLESLDRTPKHFKITQHQVGEVSDNIKLTNENLIDGECAPVGKTGSIHTECVVCTGVRFIDNSGQRSSALVSDTQVTLEVDYLIKDFVQDPHVGFKIKNRFGIVLFETNTYCMGCTIGPMDAQSKITVRFVFDLSLMADEYSITLGFGNSGFGDGSFEQVLGFLHEATVFTVLPNLKSIKWAGLINLRPAVEFIKGPRIEM